MPKHLYLLILILIPFINISAQELKISEGGMMKVEEYKLSNGLTVLLTENHDLPQIYGMIVVNAGGKHDPADATGLAHYLEHMLFKGTTELGTTDYDKEKKYLDQINELYEQLGNTQVENERKEIQKQINQVSIDAAPFMIPNELDKILASIGSTGVNAFTTEEFTAYHNSFPSNQIEKWLKIYAHRFEQPVFRGFQSELEIVYEEKNRMMDNSFGMLFEKLSASIFKNHPYGQQTILGTTEHLKNPPLKKVYEYFNTYYVPNNMALILSGDFKIDEIKPLIEAEFGNWKSKPVPEFPHYEEKPFEKGETIKTRMTPIKVGIMAFRTPPNGDKDKAAIDIALQVLSNSDETGLLDKLNNSGKLMSSGAISFVYNDYGTTLLFFIPKILRQSINKAKALVQLEIEKLITGEVDENLVEALIKSDKKALELDMESNEMRGNYLMDAFTKKVTWQEYQVQLNNDKRITTEDVVQAAKKYFSQNSLTFISRMGFPKKDKLKKPGYKPVIPEKEIKSAYRKHFDAIESPKSTPIFVDFEHDFEKKKLRNNIDLKTVNNPVNNIFDLEITFGIGTDHNRYLDFLTSYLGMIGTNQRSNEAFKLAFQKLGGSYEFSVDADEFTISIDGFEENLPELLALTNELINDFKVEESKIKTLINFYKTNKKVNRREPSYISGALSQFALYGKNSDYLRDLTKKEIKSLKASQFEKTFDLVKNYAVKINYSGKKTIQEVGDLILGKIEFNHDLLPGKKMVKLKRNVPLKTKIYFLHDKKAVQSQIRFHIQGSKFDKNEITNIQLFNNYFGGSMSGLVFQEIREFRSLAYTAYARYQTPALPEWNNTFFGFIGTQSDKTTESTELMLDLIHNMPEKANRIDLIKNSVYQKFASQKPSFRSIVNSVENWKLKGYTDDPSKIIIDEIQSKTFEDLIAFYKREIKNKPLIITIVGNKNKIDMKKLSNSGEIIWVNKKEIFVN